MSTHTVLSQRRTRLDKRGAEPLVKPSCAFLFPDVLDALCQRLCHAALYAFAVCQWPLQPRHLIPLLDNIYWVCNSLHAHTNTVQLLLTAGTLQMPFNCAGACKTVHTCARSRLIAQHTSCARSVDRLHAATLQNGDEFCLGHHLCVQHTLPTAPEIRPIKNVRPAAASWDRCLPCVCLSATLDNKSYVPNWMPAYGMISASVMPTPAYKPAMPRWRKRP